MFKLTQEQINEIIELYGGNEDLINELERRINLLGIIKEEDDYYEVIVSIVAQIETEILDRELKKNSEFRPSLSKIIDEIIEEEVNRKKEDLMVEDLIDEDLPEKLL